MQLIAILLITVSILTVLSGLTVLIGVQKGKRAKIVPYFLTAVAGAAWGISMALFITAKPDEIARATVCLIIMYISTLVDVLMLFLYVGWKRKATWVITGIIAIVTSWLSWVLATNPSRLFAEIILRKDGGNTVVFNESAYTFYLLLCLVIMVCFTIAT